MTRGPTNDKEGGSSWRTDAPLDVFVVRKLGVPHNEELAMGAIASGGSIVTNDDVIRVVGLGPEAVQAVADREGKELARREQAYRDERARPAQPSELMSASPSGPFTACPSFGDSGGGNSSRKELPRPGSVASSSRCVPI